MKITKRGKLAQLFCKHDYIEGVLDDKEKNRYGFLNLQGITITIMCQKCGKVKGTYLKKDYR